MRSSVMFRVCVLVCLFACVGWLLIAAVLSPDVAPKPGGSPEKGWTPGRDLGPSMGSGSFPSAAERVTATIQHPTFATIEVVSESGSPVHRPRAIIAPPSTRWLDAPAEAALSGDSSGVIHIPAHVSPGVSASVVADGYRSSVTTITAGHQRVVLARGAELVARVCDAAGKPLDNVVVCACSSVLPPLDSLNALSIIGHPCGDAASAVYKQRTDPSGTVHFSELCEGPLRIRLSKPGWYVDDMEPSLATAPGSVTIVMRPYYAMGVAVNGGRALSVRTSLRGAFPILGEEPSLAASHLTEKHNLAWVFVFTSASKAELESQEAVVDVLVEDHGWQRIVAHARPLDAFAPDTLEIDARMPRVASGLVRVMDEESELVKHAGIRAQSVVVAQLLESAGAVTEPFAVQLKLGEVRRLPSGSYRFEVPKELLSIMTVKPETAQVLDGMDLELKVRALAPLAQIRFTLLDSMGHEHPSGFYRVVSKSLGNMRAGFVFRGWSDAVASLPTGEYEVSLQGLDGTGITQVFSVDASNGPEMRSMTLRAERK